MEAGALAHSSSSRGERGSPCFKSISPQPAMGHPALAPATPTQAWPRWFTGGPSSLPCSLLVPRGCSRSQLDLPFPSPAFRQNPHSALGLTKGGGTDLPSEQRRGPSPKTRLGAPKAP